MILLHLAPWAILLAYIWYREREHKLMIRWIFLEWAWRVKTGEFETNRRVDDSYVQELRDKFLKATKKQENDKNAIARSKLVKSKVV